jgi:hypothetical protein
VALAVRDRARRRVAPGSGLSGPLWVRLGPVGPRKDGKCLGVQLAARPENPTPESLLVGTAASTRLRSASCPVRVRRGRASRRHSGGVMRSGSCGGLASPQLRRRRPIPGAAALYIAAYTCEAVRPEGRERRPRRVTLHLPSAERSSKAISS